MPKKNSDKVATLCEGALIAAVIAVVIIVGLIAMKGWQ